MTAPWVPARERECLRLVGEGLTHREIAWRLHVSPHTVKSDLGAVRERLRARSTAHAVALAYRTGLLDATDGAR